MQGGQSQKPCLPEVQNHSMRTRHGLQKSRDESGRLGSSVIRNPVNRTSRIPGQGGASPNATYAPIDEANVGQTSQSKSATLAPMLMAIGTVVAVILGLAFWMRSPADSPAAVEQTQSAPATEGGVPNEATRAPAPVRTGAPEGTSSDGTSMPAPAVEAPSSPKTPSRGPATETLVGGGAFQPMDIGKLLAGNSATSRSSTPHPTCQRRVPRSSSAKSRSRRVQVSAHIGARPSSCQRARVTTTWCFGTMERPKDGVLPPPVEPPPSTAAGTLRE